MDKQHIYRTALTWTGNTGHGTQNYRSYKRDHEIVVDNKPLLLCSSDPAFRGDPNRYNPEELLVASLSSCHMLWYLHLCAVSRITVLGYHDQAEGYMREDEDGSGRFTQVVLKPKIVIAESHQLSLAHQLHEQAHKMCFIANSVNFPIIHQPKIEAQNISHESKIK